MRRRGPAIGVNLPRSVVRTAHSLDEHYLRRDDYSPSRGEPGPESSNHPRATTAPPLGRGRGAFSFPRSSRFSPGEDVAVSRQEPTMNASTSCKERSEVETAAADLRTVGERPTDAELAAARARITAALAPTPVVAARSRDAWLKLENLQ